MTLFPSHFTSYLKVPKRQLITVANGDHVPIVGSGNVQLHSSLYLHNELTTGRTIVVAKKQGGLYYLQHTKIALMTQHYDRYLLVVSHRDLRDLDARLHVEMRSGSSYI
ncbi:hypothetical protein CR513_56062, partial [Mucuna pruriens]